MRRGYRLLLSVDFDLNEIQEAGWLNNNKKKKLKRQLKRRWVVSKRVDNVTFILRLENKEMMEEKNGNRGLLNFSLSKD